MKQNTKRCKAF